MDGGMMNESRELLPRERWGCPPGTYFVESGLVFRLRGDLVDDVAATGRCVTVHEDGALWSPTGALIAAPHHLLGVGDSMMRALLRVRAGNVSAQRTVARALSLLVDLVGPALPAGLQHQDIALLAGVRHETVCRVLRAMESDGSVRIVGGRGSNRQIQVLR